MIMGFALRDFTWQREALVDMYLKDLQDIFRFVEH